uniref:Uncharacterized protein n=1 Tax=Oryza nivara TaxID=4536 RepID=A0A0E0ILT3_ORYNI
MPRRGDGGLGGKRRQRMETAAGSGHVDLVASGQIRHSSVNWVDALPLPTKAAYLSLGATAAASGQRRPPQKRQICSGNDDDDGGSGGGCDNVADDGGGSGGYDDDDFDS